MMRSRNKLIGRPSQQGSALVMSTVVVFSLMTLSMAFLQVSLSASNEVGSNVDDERAQLVAEAGVSEALISMRFGASGNVGSMLAPAQSGGGLFWVQATDIGDNQTQLVSTAMVGSGRSAVELVVQGDDAPLFQATLNSKERIDLSNGVITDSYASAAGTYVSQEVNTTNGISHANLNGHVASNEGIYLNGTAHILGNASPGPGEGVSLAAGSYVSGSTTPASDPFPFDPIDVPVIASTGSLTVPNNGSQALPAGDHAFDSLSINKNATLVITGPATIVVDDFLGGKDASLVIDATAGPVTIYCQDSYTHTNGFEATAVAGSPMALAFFISSPDDIVFPSATAIRGGYYAPDAAFAFSSGNEVWGAFLSRQITMNASTKFHFDESLMDYWQVDVDGAGSNVLAWYETGVQPRALITNRRDPLTVLNLTAGDLLMPANAWDHGISPTGQ